VRCQGLVDSPGGIGADGHACWGYEDIADDFAQAAEAFLTEGTELGQALMFVGGPEAEDVVRSVEPMSSMVSDGSLSVAPFQSVYPDGRRLPDAEQWAAYAGAVAQAREGGFAGLRVLAEVTSLAGSGDGWLAHSHWESYADRRMAGDSLAALCCFDRNALSPEGLAAIASAHPVVDRRLGDLVPFRLFSRHDALAVAGELDAFSSDTLRHLLRPYGGLPVEQTLDLEELTFIDHNGVRVLYEYGERVRADGGGLTLRGGPPTLRRLADLFGVTL
jgi:anti-anti-sigma factor